MSLTRVLCIVDYYWHECGSQEVGDSLIPLYLPMDMRKNSYLHDDAFIVQIPCKEAMTNVICLRNNPPPPHSSEHAHILRIFGYGKYFSIIATLFFA
jgi:hypothetical protein